MEPGSPPGYAGVVPVPATPAPRFLMEILWFLLIGALIGWLAGQLTKGSGFGLLGNIVVGILGSMLGGVVAPLLGIASESTLGSLLIALFGAVLLLFLLRFVTKKK